MALGLLFVLVLMLGAYNRSVEDEPPAPKSEDAPALTSKWFLLAVAIAIVIPAAMLLMIWLAPDW